MMPECRRSGDFRPSPSLPIPDWRRVERVHPKGIPDWRVLQRLGLNWRGVEKRRCSPLPVPSAEHPSPYPLCTPNSTQGHPILGPPDTRGFRVVGVEGTQESAEGRNPKKTKRNGIPVADFALPNTKYQQPSTCRSLSYCILFPQSRAN
jgi:hypothetical protein